MRTHRVHHFLASACFLLCLSMGLSGSKGQDGSNAGMTPLPPEKRIFILSGQSNMAGRGGVNSRTKAWDGVVPAECAPSPAILRFSASRHWEEAREPLHTDIDTAKVCGVGPGMSFANAILSGSRSTDIVVGLVPCAIGGTAIREWARGARLYEEMVSRAKSSLGEGGSIAGLLWYQGESDTETKRDAEHYKKKMEEFVENVRSDLGIPRLPVIQVALASGDAKYIEKVRAAQLGMKLQNVYCVDAKGLPLKEDKLHLTTEAQVKLGKMLADEYLKHYTASEYACAPE